MSAEGSTAARRLANPANKPAQNQHWTTSRCHRLIRPLTSKLQTLKILLASPSVAAAVAVAPPKETRKDPSELPYLPSQQRSRRRQTDRSLFFGETRPVRDRVRRTYSGNSNRAASPQVVVTATPAPATSVYDLPFPAATIDWDAAPSTVPAAKAPTFKEPLDPSHPQVLLQSLRPVVNPELYQMYIGIYVALENIINSTRRTPTPREPPPLAILAARKIAQCILATDEELDSDDVWYDKAYEVGVGGEYLREIVRWHAIELIRDAICSNILPSRQKIGMGLPGVLVGLCRQLGAEAEAESLLKTLIEFYPLSESSCNPSLVSLTAFWRNSKSRLCRLLTDTIVAEGSPITFGNPSVNTILRTAVDEVERCDASRNLVTKALEAAFGIWGNGHIAAAARQRKEQARRKGSRRSGKVEDEPNLQKTRNGKPLPARVGERAEEMAYHLVERLVVSSRRSPHNTHTIEILQNLARGFVTQDEVMRAATEEEWVEWYPLCGKVTVLLQSLGLDAEDDAVIVKELTRCLSDLRNEMGKDGIKSLGEWVASCYANLYTSSGNPVTEEDQMKVLIARLITYASTGSVSSCSSSSTGGAAVPVTPFKPKFKLVTFTPGKVSVNPQQERERYYVTQLALGIAISFLSLNFTIHNEKWVDWLRKVEHQIIGLKLRTPAKPKASSTKERKGWRWEEGIAEWVEVGGTPGGALKKSKPPQQQKKPARPLLGEVVIPTNIQRKRTWRKEYEIFSDEPHSLSPTKFTPPPLLQDSEEEDPDTSFSRLFEDDSGSSSASEYDGEGGEYKFYAPTPIRPPSSIRRSPRHTERIIRSLREAPLGSSPMLSGRRMFKLTGPVGSVSPPTSPPPMPEEEQEEEEDEEDEEGQEEDDEQEEESAAEEEEGEEEDRVLTAAQRRRNLKIQSLSPRKRPRTEDSDYEESEDELNVAGTIGIHSIPSWTKRRRLLCVSISGGKEFGSRRHSFQRVQEVGGMSDDELAL